jgi:hypothetical protein
MMVALAPARRVSFKTHVEALGQSTGRMRGGTVDDNGAYFL